MLPFLFFSQKKYNSDHPPGYLAGVDNKIYGPISSIFAARSPIFPTFFYVIMGFCDVFGLDYHDSCIPLQRVAHTFVSGLLPLSVFGFVLAFLNHPTAAVVAAAAVTVDDFFVWIGSHHVINGFVGPIVLATLAILSKLLPECVPRTEDSPHDTFPPTLQSVLVFLAFFFSAVTTYVRPDCVLTYATFILVCFPITFFRSLLGPQKVSIFSGGLSGLFVSGFADKMFFGVWFVSARNWISYNVIEQLSILSGRQPYFFYLDAFLVYNPAACVLMTLGCVGVWYEPPASLFFRSCFCGDPFQVRPAPSLGRLLAPLDASDPDACSLRTHPHSLVLQSPPQGRGWPLSLPQFYHPCRSASSSCHTVWLWCLVRLGRFDLCTF